MARRHKDAAEPAVTVETAERTERTYTVAYPHGLNLRAEPSKQAAIVRVLKHGETVTARDAEAPDGWVVVDGGYVMREFLE